MYYKVRNCVICGKKLIGSAEKPAVYSGHVLIDNTINVIVGTCFNYRCNKKIGKRRSKDGCFGAWKPKYGVVEDVWPRKNA